MDTVSQVCMELQGEMVRNSRLVHGPVPEMLESGQVVTVEPGIYFVEGLIKPAYEDPRTREFLVMDEIEKFEEVGGVRIEDNVAVYKDRVENLTETCPKTVEEIEEIMRE